MRTRTRITLIIIAFAAVLGGAVWLTQFVSTNAAAQTLVAEYGYVAVVVLAIIAGLNTVVPVPAATFTPVFTAAGLELPLIVAALVIGTVIADLTGYYFGHWSREVVAERYPKTFTFITTYAERYRLWIIPAVTIYAAVVPFPNEAILIPLALSGVRIRTLLIPLILGNIIHQGTLAYGITSAFTLLIS